MTPQTRAERAATALWDGDRASQWMGFALDEVGEGRAVLHMTVAPHHCNGHAICHGGIIFMLADSAFAFACNSRNAATVAQHNTISFIAPGHEGDTLRAEAREVSLRGRSGLYDITITNQDGTVIAEMRGASRGIGRTVFEEDAPEDGDRDRGEHA